MITTKVKPPPLPSTASQLPTNTHNQPLLRSQHESLPRRVGHRARAAPALPRVRRDRGDPRAHRAHDRLQPAAAAREGEGEGGVEGTRTRGRAAVSVWDAAVWGWLSV